MSRIGLAAVALGIAIAGTSPAAPPESRVDLVVDAATLAASWTVERRFIPPDDCAVAEGCVRGSGPRTLLRYGSLNVNVSQTDLVLGDLTNSNFYSFDACHQHYHLRDFNESELLSLDGSRVVAGGKQDFCVIDTTRYLDEPWVPLDGQFGSCDFQGLTRGYGDLYDYCLDCQWVDVTDVAPGDYRLRLTVNPRRHVQETDYSDNGATVPVVIPDLTGQPDLVLDQQATAGAWRMDKRFFASSSCEYRARCLSGAGYRKLLRLGPRIANQGTGDLVAGTPSEHPARFVSDVCTGEPLVKDGALYELLDPADGSVVLGRRHSLNLYDSNRFLDAPWMPRHPVFFACAFLCGWNCGSSPPEKGISRGWANVADLEGSCQWLDVTDVPDGDYLLRVTVNPDGVLPEADRANDTTIVPVAVTDPPGIPHRPDDGLDVLGPPPDNEFPGVVTIHYDVSSCPASDYNLYYGVNRPVSTYRYSGAACNLGTSGTRVVNLPTPDPGDILWMVVVGCEGSTEGGHGFDSVGRERPLTGVPFCGITDSRPGSLCP